MGKKQRIEELEKCVEELEARIAQLEARPAWYPQYPQVKQVRYNPTEWLWQQTYRMTVAAT